MHFRSEWPPFPDMRVCVCARVCVCVCVWWTVLCLLLFTVGREGCTMGENVLKISSQISQNVEHSVKISYFSQKGKRQGLSIFVPGLRDFRWVLKVTHSCGQITVIGGLCVAVRAKWHMLFLQASVSLTVAVYREQCCHNLLTLMSFKTHMICFLLLNTKVDV